MKSRGFSVLELIISMSLLLLVSGTLFFLFRMCSSNFQVGMTRQSLQSQLRRISARLNLDIRQSSFYTISEAAASINVDMEPGIVPARRDAVCLGHPNGFDPITGLTVWDKYTVYTATLDLPRGRLVTYRVGASAGVVPGTTQQPWGNFLISLVSYTTVPSLKAETNTLKTLTRDLHQFQVDRDLSNQMVVVRVAVRGERGRTAEGRRSTAESAEMVFRYRAENTWPRM